jgi:hypothetical protein
MINALLECLKHFDTQPILFLGSGLSRRYLGSESWEGLMKKYALLVDGDEYSYEKYCDRAKSMPPKSGILPKVASLIESDFNKKWFDDVKFRESRVNYSNEIKKGVSPFKADVSKYTEGICNKSLNPDYNAEIDLLKKLGEKSIGGIITTNYDCLLELLFPQFTTYVGQEELIFSSIQGIGETYKIHGCCTKPSSIVLTENDYIEFENRNAYLAAKILTLFLEHPIIFLGYSLNDRNIEKILESIVLCLSPENLIKIKNRLFFAEWNSGIDTVEISTFCKVFDDGKSLDMTRIQLSDYIPLYETLFENKHKYNTHMLRKLKNDIYELVLTNKPTETIRVMDIADENLEKIETVVGVGIISKLGIKGYASVTAEDLYTDIVLDNQNYDAKSIVQLTLSELLSHNNILPSHKYISQLSPEEVPAKVMKSVIYRYEDFMNRTIREWRKKSYLDGIEVSIRGVIKKYGTIKALSIIPLLTEDRVVFEDLESSLLEIFTSYPDIWSRIVGNDKSNLKRIIRIYDWFKYYKEKAL